MGHVEIDLESALRRAGITNRQLAEKLGISEVHISRIRHGKVGSIRLETLYALCTALDCEPGDLLKIVEP